MYPDKIQPQEPKESKEPKQQLTKNSVNSDNLNEIIPSAPALLNRLPLDKDMLVITASRANATPSMISS